MSDAILQSRSGRHVVLTLNRPEKRNPLPYRTADGLLPALAALEKDTAVRAVVLTGAGKAFCSGMDLQALAKLHEATPRETREDCKALRRFFDYLREYPKPLLAALNGPAMAGGAGLALSCDIAVASEDAVLGYSEVRVGLVPALVGVHLSRAVGERLARELLLTGRSVPAAEALALGLFHEVVPAAKVLARAEALAETLAENSPTAVRLTRRLLGLSAGLPFHSALDLAQRFNAQARGTADAREGVKAFLEKRKPNWKG